MEHFGDKLRRLRGDRPQKSVAQALEIPQTTLSSLEKQTSVPRGDMLRRLADYFAVPIDYFYEVPPTQVSASAKVWLQHLRTESKGRDTVATHSRIAFNEVEREKIAQKIREKDADTSNKDR